MCPFAQPTIMGILERRKIRAFRYVQLGRSQKELFVAPLAQFSSLTISLLLVRQIVLFPILQTRAPIFAH